MKKLLPVIMAAVFLSVMAPYAAMAAEFVGSVGKVVGDATVMRDGKSEQVAIKAGTALYLKDTITTGATGRVQMNMKDGSRLMLGGKSSLVIREYMVKADDGKRKSILGLLSGKLRAIVDKTYKAAGSKFEVHTPTAVAGVMGTDFGVEVTTDGNTLQLTFEGLVNTDGQAVGAGQQFMAGLVGPSTASGTLTFVFATSTEADAAKAQVDAALALAAQVDAETDPARKAELQRQLDDKMDVLLPLITPAYVAPVPPEGGEGEGGSGDNDPGDNSPDGNPGAGGTTSPITP